MRLHSSLQRHMQACLIETLSCSSAPPSRGGRDGIYEGIVIYWHTGSLSSEEGIPDTATTLILLDCVMHIGGVQESHQTSTLFAVTSYDACMCQTQDSLSCPGAQSLCCISNNKLMATRRLYYSTLILSIDMQQHNVAFKQKNLQQVLPSALTKCPFVNLL